MPINRATQRMAGARLTIDPAEARQYLNQHFIDAASSNLAPWSEVDRKDLRSLAPGERGDPSYYGRTEEQWKDHSKEMHSRLKRMKAAGGRGPDIEKMLRQEGGYSEDEIRRVANDWSRSNQPRLMRQVQYGVAQADADEQVSALVLEAEGARNVRQINQELVTAADLRGKLDGSYVNIDAQARNNDLGSLNLSVLTHNDLIGDKYDNFGDKRLIDIIKRSIEQGGGYEGKLLDIDNRDINLAWSPEFARNKEAKQKDFIISGHRGRGANKLGPYNKRLAMEYNLIPLNKIRDEWLDLTPRQLYEDHGVDRLQVGGGLTLTIPKREVMSLSSDYPMDNVNQFIQEINANTR